MLGAWQYTPDQQCWLVQRLDPVVGAGRHLPITLLTDGSLLKQFGQGPLWEKIEVLASASKGWWTSKDRVFVIQHARCHPARFSIGG